MRKAFRMGNGMSRALGTDTMARLIGLMGVVALLIAFTLLYNNHSARYLDGFYWALRPSGFLFWFTAGMVGLLASHLGGRGRWIIPLASIAAGALLAVLASRGANLPELSRSAAPVLFLIGLAIAYAAKTEMWLAATAALIAGAAQGYTAGRIVGAKLDNLYYLGGFGASLAVFVLSGLLLGDLCARAKGGASLRTRLAAGAAGVGLYLTLQQNVSWL